MGKLDGKVAVVTGGNSGIGLAIARLFAKQGARVAIFGRDQATLAKAQATIGSDCLAVQGDVRRLDDLDRLFTQTAERFGKIDTVVANAGYGELKPFVETDEASFDAQSDTNFKGTFFTLQKALPKMNDGGTMVIVSSAVNTKGPAGMSAYAGTKAAVRSLARTLTAELGPRRIRVNALSPGVVSTPAFGRMPGLPDDAEAFKDWAPLGRVAQPEEMASVALFLASNDSSYVAGADIFADGGMAQV